MLIRNVKGLKELFSEKEYQELAAERLALIKEISERVAIIGSKVDEMVEARKVANKIDNASDMAMAYATKIFPFFDTIRYHIDKLELIVDNEMWPLPKYREMLFVR
jgi:glutamine synthetase